MGANVPLVDPGVRERLTMRFGGEVDAWFDALPGVLSTLAERWRLEVDSTIPRGSVSAVFRCSTSDGRRAVLKVSPDRPRLALEAQAFEEWRGAHTPAVIASDDRVGALLMDAIEPGTTLVDSSAYPKLESIAQLMDSLHRRTDPGGSFPLIADRVEYLFRSSSKLYERDEGLTDVVPPNLYERGHDLAATLADDELPTVLLHGDLTPGNILDGGPERCLVAIDPAPCLGDAAFDAVDLILWQADDLETIRARTERLAAVSGLQSSRLLAWCSAFAGMSALELASAGGVVGPRIEALRTLASEP